jgi:hypothetical protein
MPFPTGQILLPPKALNVGSPFDANANVVQYTQQDRANWFYFSTQAAGVSLGAGLSATATFGLYNPIASVANLIIRSIQIVANADPAAAASIWYCKVTNGANPTGVTSPTLNQGYGPIITQGGVNFGITASGVPFTAATLSSTPYIIRQASDVLTTTAPQAALDDYVNGQIGLAPGDTFCIMASAAIGVGCSIVWEEQPQW